MDIVQKTSDNRKRPFMNRLIALIVCYALLCSCTSSIEHKRYYYYFNNDTEEYLLVCVDCSPSTNTIRENHLQGCARGRQLLILSADNYLALKKNPDDSVSIYVAFMDSLLMYYDSQHNHHLDLAEIKESALIARLNYVNKDLFDENNKKKDVLTVHFPPIEDSLAHTYYYNGYSAEVFK